LLVLPETHKVKPSDRKLKHSGNESHKNASFFDGLHNSQQENALFTSYEDCQIRFITQRLAFFIFKYLVMAKSGVTVQFSITS